MLTRSSALIRSKKIACFSPKFSEWLPNIIRNKWLYSPFESSTDTGGEGGGAFFARLCFGELANTNTAMDRLGKRGMLCSEVLSWSSPTIRDLCSGSGRPWGQGPGSVWEPQNVCWGARPRGASGVSPLGRASFTGEASWAAPHCWPPPGQGCVTQQEQCYRGTERTGDSRM